MVSGLRLVQTLAPCQPYGWTTATLLALPTSRSHRPDAPSRDRPLPEERDSFARRHLAPSSIGSDTERPVRLTQCFPRATARSRSTSITDDSHGVTGCTRFSPIRYCPLARASQRRRTCVTASAGRPCGLVPDETPVTPLQLQASTSQIDGECWLLARSSKAMGLKLVSNLHGVRSQAGTEWDKEDALRTCELAHQPVGAPQLIHRQLLCHFDRDLLSLVSELSRQTPLVGQKARQLRNRLLGYVDRGPDSRNITPLDSRSRNRWEDRSSSDGTRVTQTAQRIHRQQQSCTPYGLAMLHQRAVSPADVSTTPGLLSGCLAAPSIHNRPTAASASQSPTSGFHPEMRAATYSEAT